MWCTPMCAATGSQARPGANTVRGNPIVFQCIIMCCFKVPQALIR